MHKNGILFLLITLTGCNNSENSVLIGSWITDACKQLTDSNSNPLNVWAKSTFTFDTTGSIYLSSTPYNDSNCVTKTNDMQPVPILVAKYSEQGQATTSQGIEANKITITFTSLPPPVITTSGYYKITNNHLCFSESFHFDAGGFGISPVDNTEIDFINCLSKELP